jgi:hypothetical protein
MCRDLKVLTKSEIKQQNFSEKENTAAAAAAAASATSISTGNKCFQH